MGDSNSEPQTSSAHTLARILVKNSALFRRYSAAIAYLGGKRYAMQIFLAMALNDANHILAALNGAIRHNVLASLKQSAKIAPSHQFI